MSKALLIKSQIDKNGGEVGKWNNFNNAPSYIQGIHTGKMLEEVYYSSIICFMPNGKA